MIQFSNLGMMRGKKVLFEQASLKLHAGQKVGVVGRNGCGKSSLFALLQGKLQAEAGDVSVPSHWRLGIVAQETPAVNSSALEYVVDGHKQYRQLQGQLQVAQEQNDGMRIGDLIAQIQDIGGDTIHSRAATVLSGLGFSESAMAKPVRDFSGGWRMRLNLAQALVCDADLLLLDEPTNHLDLDAVLWLEKWIANFPGTLLLISHDRDFLDTTVKYVLSFEQKVLRFYQGNYTSFELQKIERERLHDIAQQKQATKAAHLQKFIDRFGAKASKAKQAQSRKKQLEKMVAVLPAQQESSFSFSFFESKKLPNPLIKLEQANAGYGDLCVLQKIQLNLVPGSRIGLLGHNGAGKSTLVKTLSGALPVLAGECERSAGLDVGYFSQHQLEHLQLDSTPLAHLQVLDGDAREQTLRDYLGGFGFHGDDALAPVRPMSGGEKARLALALVVYQCPNLLLLDEPTNHLDLPSRTALNLALQDFAGAIILVSHDRFLLESVCDEFYLVADGQVQPFNGTLDDYQRQVLVKPNSQGNAETSVEKSSAKRKDKKRQEAEFRKAMQPKKKALQKLESQMAVAQEICDKTEALLADPDIYQEQNKSKLSQLLSQQRDAKAELAEAEEAWLLLEEEIEQARLAFEQGFQHA